MLRSLSTAAAALMLFGASEAASAQALTTELFVQGLSGAVDMKADPTDSNRFFVVQQSGRIRTVLNGTVLSTPFLDISGPVNTSGNERGLLGLALHPDYANNGRFFVNYTGPGGATFIQEYTVSADPNVANPTAVRTIAQISQDFSNHNGGCVQFGMDGMLYVGMGDGGSGNDPNNRAQQRSSRLGKMLRYDVDIAAPYIPADNPFVNDSTYDPAIYHLGLRNPWRFSFDRATGDMWIGDVGQNQREEVSYSAFGDAGLNFGWRCLEGNRCNINSGTCSCSNPAFVDPVIDIVQSQPTGFNCSVIGGYVYRGSAIAGLEGTYFYADYCSRQIWTLRYDGTTVSSQMNRTAELDPPTGTISSITAFAEDNDGELYIVTQGGRIWKITEVPPPCEGTNYCTALPNQSGLAANISAGGSFSVADNGFFLSTGGLTPGTFGLYFYGPGQTQQPLGNGNICVDGPLIRIFPIVQADFFGAAFLPVDLTAPQQSSGPGAITPGSTWNFQFWFRDVAGGQQTFNFSDATSVLFCP